MGSLSMDHEKPPSPRQAMSEGITLGVVIGVIGASAVWWVLYDSKSVEAPEPNAKTLRELRGKIADRDALLEEALPALKRLLDAEKQRQADANATATAPTNAPVPSVAE